MEVADLKYEDQLQSFAKMQFSDNTYELTNQLKELVVVADGLKSTSMKEWLCEKIDFGIIKLRSLGAKEDAESIENSRIEVKSKWWR